METTCQRKSVGVSNEGFFAGSQNGVAIAPRPIPMASGRQAGLNGSEHAAQQIEWLAVSGTVAAVFAHEVANPLNGISATLELIKRALEKGEFDIGGLIATLWPIVVVGLFVAFELLNNMVLEPLLYGESAGVSGVGLLVAIAFWTWLWGPIGLVLATPITVCVVVLSKYVPQMDFIGVLMSDEPAMKSTISYYQRLLAMDQDEAAEIVEKHLTTHPAEQIYDDLLVPALNFVRRDRELGRLTENDEQFVFQATREILEDLNSREPQSIESSSNASEAARVVDEDPSATAPKFRIIGCPARDEGEELALLMFRQLLDSTRYEIELMSDETLTSEIVSLVGEKSPALICIAALPPGGLAQTRYLCKRLRARFPNLKIAVGRWGTASGDNNKILLSAGADKVGTTMIETRDQMVQLIQLSRRSEGHSGPTVVPFSSTGETLTPEVVA